MIKLELLPKESYVDYFKNIIPDYFPKAEIKLFSALKKQINLFDYRGYKIINNEQKVIGYSFFCELNKYKLVLLDYIFIFKEQQNMGYGTETLKKLKELYKNFDSIICDIEKPNIDDKNDIKNKRLNFYLNNNFKISNVKAKLWGVDYLIIYLKCKNKPDNVELCKAYNDLYKKIYSNSTYYKQVLIKEK